MKYTIDPTMTYSEAVLHEEYLTAAKAAGKAGIFPALYHRSLLEVFPFFIPPSFTSDENFRFKFVLISLLLPLSNLLSQNFAAIAGSAR